MKKTAIIFLTISAVVCSFSAAYAKSSSLNPATNIVGTQSTDILTKYDIVSAQDLKKSGLITEREALVILSDLTNGSYGYTEDNVKEWYYGSKLAPLDDIPDSDKALFLNLLHGEILPGDEILKLDLDKKLTTEHALLYVIRLIGDTYGCTDRPEELGYTTTSQIYAKAYEKGLIKTENTAAASSDISRRDFYLLLSNALTIDMNIGGYSPYVASYEERLKSRMEYQKEQEEEPEHITHKETLDAEVTLNDDMSLSWIPDDESLINYSYEKAHENDDELMMQGLMPYNDWDISINSYDIDGKLMYGISGSYIDHEKSDFIPTREMILYVYGDRPADHITVTYSRYDNADWTESTEKSFDIDISNIKTVIEGKALSPGIFQTFEHQWVPYKISLDGGKLKKDSYYMLTSCEHSYRLPELNHRSICIFDVENDTDAFVDESHSYNWMTGGIEITEVHISEIKITGSPQNGFTLHITPESEPFKETPPHPFSYADELALYGIKDE